jgi:hypothetical protein
MPREVQLESGAVLGVNVAQFEESEGLYRVLVSKLGTLRFYAEDASSGVFINLLAVCFSAPDVQDALWKCLRRCTYNGKGISKETFSPEETRVDFIRVCVEVAKDNTDPFVKGLYAEFPLLKAVLAASNSPESSQPKIPS